MSYIVDNNRYIIGLNDKKEEIDNFLVHEVIKKIIFEIDRVCRKNDIPYALSFGSALGLYNYQGIVPWDDDGDVVINYFDRDRFVEALKNDLGEDFVFDCDEVNKKYNPLIPAFKIKYKHSYIKEKNRITLPDHCDCKGIFVDVCYFMGVPSNEKEHKKLFWKSKLLMPFYVLLDGFLHLNPKNIRKSLRKYEEETANKYKDSDYVSQTVIIPFQECPKKYVEHLAFPKHVIYPFREYDFYGKKIYSFNNIEEFSRLRYGEKALKRLDCSGEYYDPLKRKDRKSGHIKTICIYE